MGWSSMEKTTGMKESIIRSFKKCRFSVALDGSKNAQVYFDGIPNYEMHQWFVKEEFKLLDDDEDENEGASKNDKNDEFEPFIDQETPLVVEQWL